MKLTYYGHACFAVQLAGKHVIFDPFITPNELAKDIDVNSIPADFILVSHGHGDHIADCTQLAKRTKAPVISSFEICNWLAEKGVENYHPMNIGGRHKLDFGTVKCVNAVHSSNMPDGSYGGNPMGFVIASGEKNIYYSGDTALTMDMELIPRWTKIDVAVLCIGDNFTMGYEDAIEAAKMVQCATVVGVHYDTFGYIKIDHHKVKQAFNEAGITLHLPNIGETIEL
jgi:L-ascorbate metabolism protein UlaG (beta-lactamase superfamily)